MREEGLEPLAGNAGLRGAAQRIGHRARRRRRLGDGVGPRAADVVLVLGDVGEVREMAEGADDADGLVLSAGRSWLACSSCRAASSASRWNSTAGPADVLDQLEHGIAFLVAHRFAENAPEQPRVVAQRHVLLGRLFLRACRFVDAPWAALSLLSRDRSTVWVTSTDALTARHRRHARCFARRLRRSAWPALRIWRSEFFASTKSRSCIASAGAPAKARPGRPELDEVVVLQIGGLPARGANDHW